MFEGSNVRAHHGRVAARTWKDYERDRGRGSGSRPYRRNRAAILAPEPLWCALCGRRIDKWRKWPDPWCGTADHIIPVALGGHPYRLENLQPAHMACNNRREHERRAAQDGRTAKPWDPPAGLADVDAEWIDEDP